MSRIIFSLAVLATGFGLYKCAAIKPEQTRYHPIIAAEIARSNHAGNPLCRTLMGIESLPHTTGLRRPYEEGDTTPPEPEDMLGGIKWRTLRDAGLVYESEHRDHSLTVDGFTYELTPKGRALYSQIEYPTGKKEARFCLGRPILKEILAIGKGEYSIEGLNLPVRYVLKVERALPEFHDGTAGALDIKLPTRSDSGELLFPEATAVFVLERETDKVLYWEPR